MQLLFDFLTVSQKTGAGEWHRRVFFELMERLRRDNRTDVNVLLLFDSQKGIAYEDLQIGVLESRFPVEFVDCAEKNITDIVRDKKIDVFFIACVQFVGEHPEVAKLKCKVLCTIHDARDEEFQTNHLYEYNCLSSDTFGYKKRFRVDCLNMIRYHRLTLNFCRWFYKLRHNGLYECRLKLMRPFIELLHNNNKASLITVSNYSKFSVQYNWGVSENRIHVFYSPERVGMEDDGVVANSALAQLIDGNEKYFLMIGANRDYKNGYKTVNAFKRFLTYNADYKFVIVSYSGWAPEGVVKLPYLRQEDLAAAIKGCRAFIYPSLFEGFGYPPLEAMKFGKPVLCSNTTSIPEILGDAPIYFSPFYESAIFEAMMRFVNSDYDALSRASVDQYKVVRAKQESDLTRMMDLILGA